MEVDLLTVIDISDEDLFAEEIIHNSHVDKCLYEIF